MKRLLSIEWNKIFYNKGTRIFIILYFVLIILMGLILPNFKPNFGQLEINFIKLGALDFPVIWHNIAWLVGFGKYFLAIIIINNISNEYSFGTFKQNVIDGLSKLDFFKSKLYINILLVLFSTLFVAILVTGLGLKFATKIDYFNGIEFLAGYFIEILAFITFVMFLTFLLKKSSFTILALFVLYITEYIFIGIERYSRGIITTGNNTIITEYLPLKANGEIIGFPPGNVALYFQTGKFFEVSHIDWTYFTVNCIYIILFLGLSYFIIKKRDL
jgi:ABC-2 type transport system permease protein